MSVEEVSLYFSSGGPIPYFGLDLIDPWSSSNYPLVQMLKSTYTPNIYIIFLYVSLTAYEGYIMFYQWFKCVMTKEV